MPATYRMHHQATLCRSPLVLVYSATRAQLALTCPIGQWPLRQIKIAGKDKVTEWAKKFSAQQPKFIKGDTTIADGVVSGEVAASVTFYQHRVEQQKNKSTPVEWAAVQPVSCDSVAAGIAKGAPHPNAARLFKETFGPI